MDFIIVSNQTSTVSDLKDMLKKERIIVYDSVDECKKHCIKKNSFVIAALKDENESISLEEYLNYEFRLIVLYEGTAHYPYEQHFSTIFIPSDSDSDTLFATIARLTNISFSYDEYTDLIGSSQKMASVNVLINRYAKTKYPIHISGATGTGKNLVARKIHKLSGLKSKMVYVNCGACTNSNLMECSFFGCTKGAYTGATYSRNGYIKSANKSILFLDEIENITMKLQEMLLDVVETGKYKSIGSDNEVSSDFRLITASNVQIEELRDSGKLRDDFYYRIAQRTIELPKLEDHMEDIPELVQYYERIHKIIRYRIKSYETLYTYNWPGNVRELFTKLSMMHEENFYDDDEKKTPIK